MRILLLIIFFTFSFSSFSQRVVYSENPAGQRIKDAPYYHIEGKVNDNFLVFKNTRWEHSVIVYNDSMQMKKYVDLAFLPKETVSVNFFAYPQFVWIVYVYQKRNMLYCMAAKINEYAELINKPILLDSDHMSFFANKNIYGVVRSEDQSKIVVIKHELSKDGILFSRLLYNNQMQLLNRSEKKNFINGKNEYFNNFSVNNDGDLIFTGSFFGQVYSHPIEEAQLFMQKNNEDSVRVENIPLDGKLLNELFLKIDNRNHHILINSLYTSNINIEGLFTAVWNVENQKWAAVKISQLGAPIKALAKKTSDVGTALNQFYISKIILKNNGGFIVAAEEIETNYATGIPYIPNKSVSSSLYDTYKYDAQEFWQGIPKSMNSYEWGANYNNILLLDADSSGNLQWGNVMEKKQTGSGLGWFSFGVVLRGEKLDFIYNKSFKQIWLLENKSISFDGKVIDNPLMHRLRENYVFIPASGMQISENEFVIPCIHKNDLYFAKIQF